MESYRLGSYEEIKDKLRVRLMDIRANAETLQRMVHKDVGCGYALVAYLDMEELAEGGVANVPRNVAEMYGKSQGEVLRDAMEGSSSNVPPKMFVLEKMLFGFGDENVLATGGPISENSVLVLTSAEGHLGASALYYPAITRRISEIVGGDYYVLPSSIHEVLIMPDRGNEDPKKLAQMVKTINEAQVAPEEQLGNRVLHFRSDIERLQVAADMDKVKMRERERS